MANRKHMVIIGDINNRKKYLEEFPYCQICGSSYGVAIHHHYKQNKRYLNENYSIELPENYSTLCSLRCHSIVHTDENQYNRRIWGQAHNGHICWKDFDYWKTSKDGRGFADIVEEYLSERSK